MLVRAVLAIAAGSSFFVLAASSIRASEAEVDFLRDIQPIFVARCVECHGTGDAREGGLDLTDARAIRLRGDSGKKVIVAGRAADGELWKRITSVDDELRMPPEGPPLSPAQLALLRKWLDDGAEWPDAQRDKHWAYQHPQRSPVPHDPQDGWSRNAIDRYALEAMRTRGLTPANDADPARLLRRVYLDLVGLPPTVDAVNRFVADPTDKRYLAIVDQLLASPRYGEKWSRHWLDLARYSDSNGYQADQIREMWAFRDWVIDAMNDDMPYDQFTVEQLAGDLLPDATLSQHIATGFHRATTCNVEAGVDPEGNRTDQVIDRVNTTGTTWLATTLECAQCHNHKYDPISQQEYYQLFAFFNNTPMEVEQEKPDSVQFNFYGPKLWLAQKTDERARFARLQAKLKQLSEQIERLSRKTARAHEQLKGLKEQESELRQQLDTAAPSSTLVMQEMEQRRTTTIFVRGDFLSPGTEVEPNVPRAFNALPPSEPRDRLLLAKWLIDPTNPLTARVAVNRWWHELFGRGIVSTIDDFGTQGSPPTHPALLDWLAIELQSNGWSMKAIHRLIVTSSTYRQSSRWERDAHERDPDNRWLARGPRNRLPAELIRDHALAIGNLLVDAMHGPPVYPPQPSGLWRQTGRNEPIFKTDEGADRFRRGVYVVWRRAAPYPTFVTFDAPDRMTCVARRPKTNTPLQALALLNDEAYAEAAKAMAARVLTETQGRDVSSQLEYAMKLVVSRAPTETELAVLRDLLRSEIVRLSAAPERVQQLCAGAKLLQVNQPASKSEWAAWFSVCNTLLNLDEAITK